MPKFQGNNFQMKLKQGTLNFEIPKENNFTSNCLSSRAIFTILSVFSFLALFESSKENETTDQDMSKSPRVLFHVTPFPKGKNSTTGDF